MSHFLQIGSISVRGSQCRRLRALASGSCLSGPALNPKDHEETRTFLRAGDGGRDVKPGSREIMQLTHIMKFLETESFRARRRWHRQTTARPSLLMSRKRQRCRACPAVCVCLLCAPYPR